MAEISRKEAFLPLDFGDTELPQFEDNLKAVRHLDLSFKDLMESQVLLESDLDKLQASFALRKIDDIVATFVTQAARGIEMSEVARLHLENAVVKKEWSGVDSDSPEKFVLRELIAKANRLKFLLIQKWIETAEDTGLTPVATLEYQHVMPAMAAADLMFIKMVSERPSIGSSERSSRGLTNECAVIRGRGDNVREVPYHEAYPEETDAMIEAYTGLISALKSLRTGVSADPRLCDLIDRKLGYYTAVLEGTRTSKLEVWQRADALLPQQVVDGSDVAHYHPIEVGYMEDRILRAPEVGLRAPDLKEGEAQQRSADTKQTMLESLRDVRLADCSAVVSSLDLLERSNAAVRHFLGSGMEMDLKPAGQILPNDYEARMIGGVDSSLDMESAIQRFPLAQGAFIRVFGQGVYNSLFTAPPDLNESVGGSTASHELGHAVGLVDGSKERLGATTLVNPYIEEWKATVAGMVGNYYIPVLNGKKDLKALKGWLLGQITIACRYSMLRNHPHMAAYFRHSQMLMKVAEESGVLESSEGDDKWGIDVSDEKVMAYAGTVFEQFKKAMEIYGKGSEEELCQFLGEHLQTTPFMEFVCSQIDVPHAELYTPQQLAKLPQQLERERVSAEAGVHEEQDSTKGAVGAVMEKVN